MIGQLPEACGEQTGEDRRNQTQPIFLRAPLTGRRACSSRQAARWDSPRFKEHISLWLRGTSEDKTLLEFGARQHGGARMVNLPTHNTEAARATRTSSTAKRRLISLPFQRFEERFLRAHVKDRSRVLDRKLPDDRLCMPISALLPSLRGKRFKVDRLVRETRKE